LGNKSKGKIINVWNFLRQFRGAKNRSSLVTERLFADEIQEICGSVIEQAKAGNMQAAKVILDRVLPPMKDKPILIDLPKMASSSDKI
jgi:hypothetical protein